jgi:uncharacterized Rmd1/YagE family protein
MLSVDYFQILFPHSVGEADKDPKESFMASCNPYNILNAYQCNKFFRKLKCNENINEFYFPNRLHICKRNISFTSSSRNSTVCSYDSTTHYISVECAGKDSSFLPYSIVEQVKLESEYLSPRHHEHRKYF